MGSYSVVNSQIVATEYSSAVQNIRPLDLVKVTDYFCKIDPSKMCQLRIILRKIELNHNHNKIIGKP